MPPNHRTPLPPLAGFKQVSKRPPRFECVLCSGTGAGGFGGDKGNGGRLEGFVMDRNAMVVHSKMAEHRRREEEEEEEGWRGWNDGVREWGGVGQEWDNANDNWYGKGDDEDKRLGGGGWGGDADAHAYPELQRWEPTEEESERWQFADDKVERVRRWVEAVNLCREELEQERRRGREKEKNKARGR